MSPQPENQPFDSPRIDPRINVNHGVRCHTINVDAMKSSCYSNHKPTGTSEGVMVDSISGNNNSIQDASLLNISQQQSVEKTNLESAKESASVTTMKLVDEATISDAAKNAYESEKEVLRFSRLAQRIKEPYDAGKVAQMKNMVDSGRINEYLSSINTDELVDSMLNSPSGAFLR